MPGNRLVIYAIAAALSVQLVALAGFGLLAEQRLMELSNQIATIESPEPNWSNMTAKLDAIEATLIGVDRRIGDVGLGVDEVNRNLPQDTFESYDHSDLWVELANIGSTLADIESNTAPPPLDASHFEISQQLRRLDGYVRSICIEVGALCL